MPSVTIRWGSTALADEEPTNTISFPTQAELDAYLKGVNDMDGWLYYEVLEEDKTNSLFEKLTPILEAFEMVTLNNTGMSYYNGGFAKAEYDYHEDEEVFVTLLWGVCNEDGKTEHTEHYRLAMDVVMSEDLTPLEKQRKFEGA